ncbi:MAG: hypothetical protein V1900_02080 [Candidatus Aenigmatarchaeota archaeon]
MSLNTGWTNLPQGSLDEYHEFRTQKYHHLYFCQKCVRNFETIEAVDKCIHCSDEVVEIPRVEKKIIPIKKRFRYYCSACEKSFESEFKHDECQICGNKIVHFYRWEELGMRDRIFIRLFKTFRYTKPREKSEKKLALPKFAMPKIEMPKFQMKGEFSLPRFFVRNNEELPSR